MTLFKTSLIATAVLLAGNSFVAAQGYNNPSKSFSASQGHSEGFANAGPTERGIYSSVGCQGFAAFRANAGCRADSEYYPGGSFNNVHTGTEAINDGTLPSETDGVAEAYAGAEGGIDNYGNASSVSSCGINATFNHGGACGASNWVSPTDGIGSNAGFGLQYGFNAPAPQAPQRSRFH